MTDTNTLEADIQAALDEYRPNLYMDGGDVEVLRIDDKGIVHLKMMGACIDCPISLLTMKLGIQRLLKEKFPDHVKGINAITDIDISALYNRDGSGAAGGSAAEGSAANGAAPAPLPAPIVFRSNGVIKPAPVSVFAKNTVASSAD